MAQRYFIVMEEEEENADDAGVGYREGRGRASAGILRRENARVKELKEDPWGGKRGGGGGGGERERQAGRGRGEGEGGEGSGKGRQDGGGDEAGRNNLCGV